MISDIIRLFQLAALGLIAGILLSVSNTLGEMTYQMQCHADPQIDRMVCFIGPMEGLVYRSGKPGDNA